MQANRRQIMKLLSLTAASGLSRFGSLPLLAQSSGDYKALVAVALVGGNDGNSLLLPLQSASFAAYSSVRGTLALPQGQFLPIQAGGITYGMHPSLAPLQSVYGSGRLAFVANVGNLIEPTTRASVLSGAAILPDGLYGHDSQTTEFGSAGGSSTATAGWGGLLADQFLAQGGSVPTLISMAGSSVFSKGQQASSLLLSSPSTTGYTGFDNSVQSNARYAAFQAVMQDRSETVLADAVDTLSAAAEQQMSVLQNAVAQAGNLKTVFPSSSLGNQMRMVAQLIKARGVTGATRQVFCCQIGGFDMHSSLLATSTALLAEVAAAMAAFDAAMIELGLSQNVTAFTMSEFSRTLQPNTTMGIDHAWGSNHMVVGGAVRGGQVYGKYPSLELGGPDDSGSIGQWVPTTATVQYSGALAKWFGLSGSAMGSVFPLLSNFGGSTVSLFS